MRKSSRPCACERRCSSRTAPDRVGRRAQVDDVRALKALHLGATFEDNALLDAERRTRDVATYLGRPVKLHRSRRLDVPDDVALDDDGAAADLGRDLGALADVQGVVRRDLTGEGAVDPDLAFKGELALELRPLTERRVQIAAGACVRVPLVLLHFPSCLRFWSPRWLGRLRRLVPRLRHGEHRLTGFATWVTSSLERGTEHYDVNATRNRTLSSQNGLHAAPVSWVARKYRR